MKYMDDVSKDNIGSGYEDKHIALVDCNQASESEVSWSTDKIRTYCPGYDKDDFLYGGFDT